MHVVNTDTLGHGSEVRYDQHGLWALDIIPNSLATSHAPKCTSHMILCTVSTKTPDSNQLFMENKTPLTTQQPS